MSRDAYPIGPDLEAYLTAAGIDLTAMQKERLELHAQAGRSLVERKVGRRFLADTANTVYTFGLPEGGDWIDLPDFATVASVAYQPTGSTSTAWVLDTDYTLERENGGIPYSDVTPPYVRLNYLGGPFRAPLSHHYRPAIRVTGRQGYGVEIPDDVWLAMVAVGAGLSIGAISTSGEFGGIKRHSRSDVMEDYGDGKYSALSKDAKSLLSAVVGLYKRHTL